MNKPLDREGIAKAMKEAAWVAKHGTREERSGKFLGSKATALEPDRAKPTTRPGQARDD